MNLVTLGMWVMALGGLGHHLPGWIRAYTDPILWQQYRMRLIVGPIVVLGFCITFAFLNLNALVLVYGAWSVWHGASQVHGFHRIYDSKVGAIDSITARLDLVVCLAWFVSAVLHSPGKLVSLIGVFYSAGGPLVPVELLNQLKTFCDVGTALVTVAFLWHTVQGYRLGRPGNPVKLLAMVSSIGFWWGCLTLVDELIWGVLLWEIFHVVQYNTLAWVQGRYRVEKGMPSRWLERVMFRPGADKILLYIALTCIYGILGVILRYDSAGAPEKIGGSDITAILTRIAVASAILHFYFDGFIWQIRQGHIRASLGLEVKASENIKPPPHGLAHAWKWLLFIGPAIGLGWMQMSQTEKSGIDRLQSLTGIAPKNWGLQVLLGYSEMMSGQFDSASVHLKRAIDLNPNQSLPHQMLADIEKGEGRVAEAVFHLESSIRLDPKDPDPVEELAQIKLEQGDVEGALLWLQRLSQWETRRDWASEQMQALQDSERIRTDSASAVMQPLLRPN